MYGPSDEHFWAVNMNDEARHVWLKVQGMKPNKCICLAPLYDQRLTHGLFCFNIQTQSMGMKRRTHVALLILCLLNVRNSFLLKKSKKSHSCGLPWPVLLQHSNTKNANPVTHMLLG
eukprot:TRINITY_DN3460_c0_g2_i1.p1 TRINITY_DN3460_c0_g2~~TRINITY_DN3460_c0_g2_i1.p1  ORF type:complete len:117 (+),score=18.38 TRINITY_DN3460_c0_g2_i1:225-575(+)